MTVTRLNFALAVLLVGGAAIALVVQHQGRSQLSAEVLSLRQQFVRLEAENASLSNRLARARAPLSPHLPAPPVQFAARPAEPVDASDCTNLFARLPGLKAKTPIRIAAGQLESYLQTNNRSAASLLAAYRVTRAPALLQEAASKYSTEPKVALEAVSRTDASPEERRQWLESFKQSDPANALPNYLSALAHFKAGQSDQAVQELMAASSKPQFDDYSAQRTQENEQAYLAAGYSPAEAKAMAPLQQAFHFSNSEEEAEATFVPFKSQLTQLGQVKDLCLNVVDLAQAYQQSGDDASAQAALKMCVELGQRFSTASGEDGISRLVGSAAELIALSRMDSNAPYGDGQTIRERISQLKQQRTSIRRLYEQAVPLLGSMSQQDWTGYSERARAFGEPAALQWVVGKFGQR